MRRTGRQALLFSISTVLAACFAPAAETAEKQVASERCLVLEQQDWSVGKMTLYLGERHLRVDGMNGRCIFLASAPGWHVTVYNTDRQVFTATRLAWREKGMEGIEPTHRGLFDFSHKVPRPVSYLGKSAYAVTLLNRGHKAADRPGSTAGGAFELMYQPNNRAKAVTASISKRTYIASSDFSLNDGVAGFVEGFYLTNPQARVLLYKDVTIDHIIRREFETRSIAYRTIPLTFFAIPKGLKAAHSLTAVATGSDIESIMLDASESRH